MAKAQRCQIRQLICGVFSHRRAAQLFLLLTMVTGMALLWGCGGSGGSNGGLTGAIANTSLSGQVVLPAGLVPQMRGAVAGSAGNIEVWLEQNPEIKTICDAQGRYLLHNVPADVAVNVIARWQESTGDKTYIQRASSVLVSAGANLEVADTRLELADNRLIVMVRDLFGNPLALAQFSVWGIKGQTDMEGRLITPAVPASVNSVLLTIQAGGFTPFTFEMPVFTNDLGPVVEINLATQQDARRTPVITFQASPTGLAPSATGEFSVLVMDPDKLLPANYQIDWTATHGSLAISANQKKASWKAPDESGLATISVAIVVGEFKSRASIGVSVGGSYLVNSLVSSVTPNSAAAGQTIVIKGYGFGEASANNRVLFASLAVLPVSWTSEEIKVVVPVDAESGPLTLNRSGSLIGGGNFTVIDYVTTLSPLFGPPETIVTLTGFGFGDVKGTNQVTLRGDPLPIIKWTNTEIQAKILLSSRSGNLAITIRNRLRPVADYVVSKINTLSPTSVTRLTDGSPSLIKISGIGFGEEQADSKVIFNDGQPGNVASWNDSEIEVEIPFAAISGKLELNISGAGILTPHLAIVYADTYSEDFAWSGPIFDSKPFLPGIALLPSGEVLVTDYDNGWVWRFNSDGEFLERIGSPGSGNGQFNYPWGIVVDNNGNIFVADADRVQKLDADGNYVTAVAGSGAAAGQFNFPQGIAVDSDGNIYVADSGNDRVQKVSNDLLFISEFGSGGIGDGEFDSPAGVAVSPDGRIYVADRLNHRIQEFAADGSFLRWYGLDEFGNTGWKMPGSGRSGRKGSGASEFDEPYGVWVSMVGDLWVGDSENGRIQKIDRATGAAQVFGSEGRNNGQFMGPVGLAIIGSEVVVADSQNSRVQVISDSGDFLRKIIPDTATLNTTFTGVAIDRLNEMVYALDRGDSSIAVYDLFGNFQQRIGSSGSGNGQLLDARGIAVDADGNLLIADTGNARIVKMSPTGEHLLTFGDYGSGAGQFKSPERIAVNSKGNILVSDYEAGRVLVFAADGAFISSFGSYGIGNAQFAGPLGIVAAPDDSIYVADSGNARIQKFTATGNFLGWLGADENGNADWHGSNTSNRGVDTTVAGGAGPCRFDYPTDLAVDTEGCLMVLDFTGKKLGANQIQKFGPAHASENNAHYVAKIGSAAGFAGVALDEVGILFATDQNQQIIRLLPSLSY